MKLSRNTIMVPINDTHHWVASTLTRAVFRMTNDRVEFLKNDPDKLDKEDLAQLKEKGIVVEDDLNEKYFLNHLIKKGFYSNKTLKVFIAFTTNCNFRCEYCDQDGQVEKLTMNEEIQKGTIAWFRKTLTKNGFSECRIDIYGGEPLLEIDMIVGFLSEIKKITDSIGIPLITNMFTNGYLFSEENLVRLLDFNLKKVQVTIDGPRDVHNERRKLAEEKGERDTFDTIIKNVTTILDKEYPVEIIWRTSVDASNIQSVTETMDYLRGISHYKNLFPYFQVIHQTTAQSQSKESFCSRNIPKGDKLLGYYTFLFTEAKKRGIKIPEFFPLGPCMANENISCVIDPKGDIYKCLDMMDIKDLSVGNVLQGDYNPAYYNFLEHTKLKKCLDTDCPFVPICCGGCAMKSYLADGDYEKPDCNRAFLLKLHKVLFDLNY